MSAKLSDVEKFVLIGDKITKFILKEDHVDNKGRCKFFLEFGFTASEPEILARALIAHRLAARHVRYQRGTVGEERVAIDGPIETPDGRGANVRTI